MTFMDILIDNNAELTFENGELKRKISELKEENSRLSCLISSKEDRIEELENKCDEYAEANNELGERIAELNKKLNERLVIHSTSNTALKHEIDSLNADLAEANKKIYLLECEKAMSNFTKIFAGGEADCSKCVYREESEKKDKDIEELMNENDILNKQLLKKDSKLNSNVILLNLTREAKDALMEQNRRYRVSICKQNATINDLQSELEGAIKDRDRAYKELHDIKKINREMVICKLRKERDKAINDLKSLEGSHEEIVKQRNHYKGLSEKLECCNNSLRYDLNALKYDFVKFDSNDILHRVYDNVYVVDDGKHVKGFIIVNKKHTEDLTNVMTYYTYRNIFMPKLFTEFTLPKAHYELAVYND